MAYGDIDAGMTEAEKQHLTELEAICEKQSEHISKLGKQIAEHKKLLFQQRKIHEWSTTLHEIDLAEIQAAWCDFDAVVDKLRKSKDICPVCLTWSWAPCDEGDEGARPYGEEWALCQCCNDSRIAMLWKGRAEKLQEKCDAAFTGLLGASRGECIAWGRRERQPEIDKLRKACEARDTIIRFHARHTYGCPAGGTMDNDCTCDYEKRMAALGEGDGG